MLRMGTVVAVLYIFLILSLPSVAQDTATIVGTVLDSTGAVIPHVKITVANPDKGINRTTISDSVGAYPVAPLPIGTFSVTAELAGIQRLVQTGVTLDIGQTQRVDLTMQAGTTNQEITVSKGFLTL